MPPIFFSFSGKIHIPCTKGIRVLITAVVVTLRCPLTTVIIALSKFINIIVSKCTWKKKGGGGNQRREVKIPKKSRGLPRVWVIPLLGLIVSNMSEEEYKPFGWI